MGVLWNQKALGIIIEDNVVNSAAKQSTVANWFLLLAFCFPLFAAHTLAAVAADSRRKPSAVIYEIWCTMGACGSVLQQPMAQWIRHFSPLAPYRPLLTNECALKNQEHYRSGELLHDYIVRIVVHWEQWQGFFQFMSELWKWSIDTDLGLA